MGNMSFWEKTHEELTEDLDPVVELRTGLIPFQTVFSINDDQSVSKEYNLQTGKLFKSLTVYIRDDGLGPILINAAVKVEGLLHQLGQPDDIFDAEGYSCHRFYWAGEIPLSANTHNVLMIKSSNFSGTNVKVVQVTGSLER